MLSFFVPCRLQNFANHGGHWRGKAGYQKRLREGCQLIGQALAQKVPAGPLRIRLKARVWNLFDEHDGLRNACKPLVDGLVRARVIADDGPASGHQFLYAQVVDRTRRGVEIQIESREDTP